MRPRCYLSAAKAILALDGLAPVRKTFKEPNGGYTLAHFADELARIIEREVRHDPIVGPALQKVNLEDTLAVLEALGFDMCKLEAGSIHVGCSQCEALVINRTATHEQGCPNQKHECAGCNALLPRGQKYCQDCAA